jgi:hypothetical protein
MTTTAQPRRQQPGQQQHNDLKHGPVAAAFNASAGTLFLTTIGKLVGLPPWIALLAGVLMAVCLVWSGRHRQPRPLSRKSLIYRAVAMLLAGGWMWWQLATFPPAAVTTSQAVTLPAAWLATVIVTVAAAGARRVHALVRFAAAGTVFVFTAGLTAVLGRPVFAWLHVVLTVTDRLPHDFGHALPWLGYSALSTAMIAAPMAVLGVAFANRELDADEELARLNRASLPRSSATEGRKIQKLVCDLSNEWTERRSLDPYQPSLKIPNLRVADVQFWDNGAGESYIFDLTGNQRGTTSKKLRTYTDELATKLNLAEGCGVEVLPAKDDDGETLGRGFAALSICRKNVLRDQLMYPPIRQRSILNPLPLGQTRAGEEIGPYFRESSAYVWGQKGSGKTVTIFDIIAGGLQCTDCLVWVIDLNGGAAAAPFLSAWYEGRVDRPCIDWVATTIDEVAYMAEVGRAIAVDRKVFYRKLKRQFNVNLMPVGNGGPGQAPPEILIVIDEGAQVLGLGGGQMTDEGRAARSALNDIMDLARDAAVNIVFSGLRATSDVADTSFKAGTAIRIGMRVTDDAELAYGFGDYSLSSKEIPYPGSGFICCGHDESDVKVFKSYYLDPDRCEDIGEQTTAWRPYVDERGLKVGGSRYANRWRRTARYIWDDPRPEMVEYGAGPVRESDRLAAAAAGEGTDGGGSVAVLDPPKSSGPNYRAATLPPEPGGWDQMMQAAKKARSSSDQQHGGQPPEPAPGPPAGPPPVEPPADPPAAAGPHPDGETLAQEEFDRRFQDMVNNARVLPTDPQKLVGFVPLPPDAEVAAAHPGSRQILERLVKVHGPLGWDEMHKLFNRGGDWGPGVRISKQAMAKLLKKPGTKDPVDWLADREPGDPYTHRDSL